MNKIKDFIYKHQLDYLLNIFKISFDFRLLAIIGTFVYLALQTIFIPLVFYIGLSYLINTVFGLSLNILIFSIVLFVVGNVFGIIYYLTKKEN